ncbi:cell division protein ZapD [soil metagenome]
MILYEYPFNERIRTLLRLEDLFDRFDHYSSHGHPYDHHAALVTLFEVLEVASRADLKSDLLQELERQRQALGLFRQSPDVALETLDAILGDIERSSRALMETTGKTGQYLRENDWLMAIRSRTIIPGGACEFDLPAYYAWQQRPLEERQAALHGWIAPMLPLRASLAIVLRLLRESSNRFETTAAGGSYQQSLTGRGYQMLQLRYDPDTALIPEISANKHVLWIRFTCQGADGRNRPFDGPVTFELSLCNL